MADEVFQPKPEHIIEALQEELDGAYKNRHYLLALIKSLQAELQEQKQLWDLERASILAEHSETEAE